MCNYRKATIMNKCYTSNDIYITSFPNATGELFKMSCSNLENTNARILVVEYARCRVDISLPRGNWRCNVRTKFACTMRAYAVNTLCITCI